MAYEKYTWVDGELITAEKLNHMEDGIAEGGDCGYECTETTEQLFTETVTTAERGGYYFASLNYAEPIEADELIVVFNGTEYVCPKIVSEGTVFYGGFDPNTATPDFTNYPFAIGIDDGVNYIITESQMTVTVSVTATSSTVETTECFERAVKSACETVLVVNARESSSPGTLVLDKTWAEIQEAMVSHGVVVHMELVGGGDIYSPVVVRAALNIYSVLMLDGTDVMFTTVSVNGHPQYDQSSPN